MKGNHPKKITWFSKLPNIRTNIQTLKQQQGSINMKQTWKLNKGDENFLPLQEVMEMNKFE